MLFYRKSSAVSMHMICIAILACCTYNVRAQSPDDTSTDGTSTDLSSMSPIGDPTVTSTTSDSGRETTTSDSAPANTITSTNTDESNTDTSPGSIQSTTTYSSLSSSQFIPTYTTPDSNPNTTDSSTPVNTTIPVETTPFVATTTRCYPNKFPFGKGCIDASENGGVVIAAFILSILSFIGVLAAASYMLFFRKYFSKRKNRVVNNYNVSQQEMKVTTRPDHKSTSLPKRHSRGTLIKQNLNPKPDPPKDATIRLDTNRVQKPNVLNKQPVATAAKMKQRPNPNQQPKPQNTNNYGDDNAF